MNDQPGLIRVTVLIVVCLKVHDPGKGYRLKI